MSDPDFASELSQLRRRLHAVPEVGLELPRTQEAVLAALGDTVPASLDIMLGESCTSVTAVLSGGRPGPTVLLRADMDALPIDEQVDLPYRSRVPGAMHACGHDLHMAMLVGATQLLAANRDHLAGSVVLMFQPGEEGFDGAGRMIEEGVLDVTGERPVAAFALHAMSAVWPRGAFATRSGPLMAACDGVYVTVRGAGGHGSAPHLTRDPIPAACEMVGALQTVVSRRLDPFGSAVVTVGQFHSGTKRTIIPERADFEITVRTLDVATRREVLASVKEICEHVARAHRVEATVECRREYPTTSNTVAETTVATELITDLFGPERLIELRHPVMASEDFSRVLDHTPGAMVFLGACPAGFDPLGAPYNHSPQARFDDSLLADGAELLATLAQRTLTGAST